VGWPARDVFTRITIGVAAFWIILCVLTVKLMSTSQEKFDPTMGGAPRQQQSEQGAQGQTAPAGDSQDASGASAPAAPAGGTPAEPGAGGS